MSAAKHKIVKVGVMPLDEFKKRTIAIAKGQYKPKRGEPKIWFRSMKSLAHVLSEENQALLRLIMETHPKSIKELEGVTGRTANNLLRTLRMMENYGFVKLREGEGGRGRAPLIPEVIYSAAEIEVDFC
ncbi:MAG: transcriptional regulator [Gammaproteobacteria bacterium RIFCSPHIGHO2_12_FULL_43_28]|nr:MAG: transcriptional regulator [Gammaproteobacteria bacterium RIFCSPHIGHO2_12_FULL_43_28]